MNSSRILVTPRSVTRHGHSALQKLRDAGWEVVFCTPGKMPDEEELIRLLPGCVGYLAGVEKITARVLEVATGLRVISRNGTGVDNVDTAVSSMSMTYGHSATESLVAILEDTNRSTGLNIQLLEEIAAFAEASSQ